MKKVQKIKWGIEEANDYFKQNLDQKYWEFLNQQLNYNEITFSAKEKAFIFPSYIPIKDLLSDILSEIDKGNIAGSKCRICECYFNIDKEDGIFGDPQKMERFICLSCASDLTAKDFYENHLKM